MAPTAGQFLENMTWVEAKARLDAGALVVIPIGAAAKQHGRHLPLNTDYIVARALAQKLAEALPVVVAPVVGFGYYPAFTEYAGSQHLRAETFQGLLFDLMDGLIGQGATAMALINTGVSTEPVVRLAVRAIYERHGLKPAVADLRALGRATDGLFAQKSGGHADERETSLMLAIAPGTVRMDKAVPDDTQPGAAAATVFYQPGSLTPGPAGGGGHSPTGALGDPSLATAEKGRALLTAITGELVDGLGALFPRCFAK